MSALLQFTTEVIMPPPLIGGGIKRCFCLTSVWLSRSSGLSREQTGRHRKTKIDTEIAYDYVTRDSDTTFKVKRSKVQGYQVALLTAVLARQAAAAVGVRTCWPWETAATLPSARRRNSLRRPRGIKERGRGIPWRPLAKLVSGAFWYGKAY